MKCILLPSATTSRRPPRCGSSSTGVSYWVALVLMLTMTRTIARAASEAVVVARRRSLKGMMMAQTGCSGGRMMMPARSACPPVKRRSVTRSPTGAPTTASPTEVPTPGPTGLPTPRPTSAPTDAVCASAVSHTNGHKYALVATASPFGYWEVARAEAEELVCCGARGHLATISDAAENALVATVATDARQWIGFKDVSAEGPFRWVDGTPFNFTNWEVGRNGTASIVECGAIDPQGEWTVYDCSHTGKRRFIVEFDCA